MHREIRKGVWRGTKMPLRQNCTPEVCLEVVRNGMSPFSTATRSVRRGLKIPIWENEPPPRSVLRWSQTLRPLLGPPEGVTKCWYDIWTPPRFVWRWCETPRRLLAPPEDCLEVVPKESLSFSTTRGLPCDTPKMARGQIRRIPEVHPSGSGKS